MNKLINLFKIGSYYRVANTKLIIRIDNIDTEKFTYTCYSVFSDYSKTTQEVTFKNYDEYIDKFKLLNNIEVMLYWPGKV